MMEHPHDRSIHVHLPPVQLARHVNDEETLRSATGAQAVRGFETDVFRSEDRWRVGIHRGTEGVPLDQFLRRARTLHVESLTRGRLKALIEVVAANLSSEDADRLLDQARAGGDTVDVRFVSFVPEVINALYHAAMGRDVSVGCQIYIQGDNIQEHVQWAKRERLGLPPEIGYHLRLHAFSPSTRPTYIEAAASGRRISTTGWNPLYRGWRDIDLSEVWNVRRR